MKSHCEQEERTWRDLGVRETARGNNAIDSRQGSAGGCEKLSQLAPMCHVQRVQNGCHVLNDALVLCF